MKGNITGQLSEVQDGNMSSNCKTQDVGRFLKLGTEMFAKGRVFKLENATYDNPRLSCALQIQSLQLIFVALQNPLYPAKYSMRKRLRGGKKVRGSKFCKMLAT